MLLATIAAFTYAFNLGIVSTLFPVLATELGVSAYQIGLLFLLSNLAQTLVFVFSESLVRRLGVRSFLIGAAVFAGSLMLIAFVEDVVAFTAPLIGIGFAQGLLYSSSLFYLLRESGSSPGHVTGRFESVLGLASFLGPFVGGVVAQYGSKYPYLAGAFLSAFVILIQMWPARSPSPRH
jgi:MFS family permease